MRAILKEYNYIPIVEPSIRMKGYAYDEGSKRNVFIRDAEGNNLIGKVWAGDVTFPDFFHPNATQYWKDMMQYLYEQVPFSGVWLDMN
jgi:alpha-glucosidase (family GH31 glycosyl hydrolase)